MERAGAERVFRGWVTGAGVGVGVRVGDEVGWRENGEGVVRNASSSACCEWSVEIIWISGVETGCGRNGQTYGGVLHTHLAELGEV
jgi:hypothetical protein